MPSFPTITTPVALRELCDAIIEQITAAGGTEMRPLPMDRLLDSAGAQVGRLLMAGEIFEAHISFISMDAHHVVLLRNLAEQELHDRALIAAELRRITASGGVVAQVFMAYMTPAPLIEGSSLIQLVAGPAAPETPRPAVVLIASTPTEHAVVLLSIEEQSEEGFRLREMSEDEASLLPVDDPLLANPFDFTRLPSGALAAGAGPTLH